MPDVRLTKASSDDAPVLFELLQQLAHDLGKEQEFRGSLASLLAYGFTSPAAFEAIIAWRGKNPLGFILFFSEFSTWRGSPGIYVQDLFVAAEARGCGLAAKLTAAAVEQGRRHGASYMRLSVHNSNEQAFGFYQALGFRPAANETVLVLEGERFDGLSPEQA
ncbi:MAG: GNAT family N-acetyltransferase [Halieaceae bacterium]|jgi:ribosomal protein S18 acetylase RimI-like enzyme|nr:GNAT family N-acetyltransferase [Halieaceae bacterium]